MRLINCKLLVKLKVKNQGNRLLVVAIDGFFFFDVTTFRVMMLLEFRDGEATVVWTGSHQEYERVFRNNKKRINKWLKSNEWI